MSYKSIAVHLDTSKRVQLRLEIALRLARQFEADLMALFAVFVPEPQTMVAMAGSAEYYSIHEEDRKRNAAAIERLFKAEVTRADVPGRWIETGEYGQRSVSRYGRCADLIVLGQDDPGDPESFIADHFAENLIMSGGRPVLLIPYAGEFALIGTRVMIAWDGSREATRAVHDALPFLKRAQDVTVVSVNEHAGHSISPPSGEVPGADVAVMLARHGVEVAMTSVESGKGLSTGEALLSQASDLNADLLVMGAYGHARWQELMLGGATRTLLEASTLPVLFSH
jgi:nucleotide-binding universal stress UspA family protein